MRPLAGAIVLMAARLAATAASAQYTPFHHDSKFLLEGNWQSCFDERIGQFDEKIYDQPQLDLEVHLGPGDEFAMFVDGTRIERLVARKLITAEQAERFRREGAVGSHLEVLQRDDGYKGFNQTGISEIIRRTDPRHATQMVDTAA